VGVLAYPAAAGKLEEQRAVQAARSTEVRVLDRGRLAQLGVAQPARQALVVPAGGFAVDQQAKSVLARQVGRLRGILQFGERLGHGGQAKAAQALGRGMDQHGIAFQ